MTMLPFLSLDTFLAGAHHLEFIDIMRLGQVCKENAACAKNPKVIRKLFETAGIPQVIGIASSIETLKIVLPMTVTSASIQRYFGRVVEQPPPISLEMFNRLHEPNSEGRENYVLVFSPSRIGDQGASEQTLSSLFPGTLDHYLNCPMSRVKRLGKHRDSTDPERAEVFFVKKTDPTQALTEHGTIETPSRVQFLYGAIIGEQTRRCPHCLTFYNRTMQ